VVQRNKKKLHQLLDYEHNVRYILTMERNANKGNTMRAAKIKELSTEINAMWDAHKPGQNTDAIDAKTLELRELKQADDAPVTNWNCDSDGQWWV
jgi:hypothetical protein